MKIIKIFALFTAALLLITSSCEKDDDKPSNFDLLTAHSWTVVKVEMNGELIAIEECENDDFFTFNKDNTFTANPGTILCDPSQEIENGSWALNGNTLNVYDEYTLIELTANKLVFSATGTNSYVYYCEPYN